MSSSHGFDVKLRSLLNHLIEPLVELEDSESPPEAFEGVYSVFVNHTNEVVGGLAADYAAAAYLGGSISEIAPDVVARMTLQQQLRNDVKENVEEIFNICTQCFMKPESISIHIETFEERYSYPANFQRLEADSETDEFYRLEVQNYGSGLLRVIAV